MKQAPKKSPLEEKMNKDLKQLYQRKIEAIQVRALDHRALCEEKISKAHERDSDEIWEK